MFSMPVTYPQSKSRYRITLELDVQEDFNPHNINWERVLDVQGNEKISSYVEDLSTPDFWWLNYPITRMEEFAEFESLIGIISEIPDEPVEEESTEEWLNYPVVHPTGNKYFMVLISF